MQLSSVFCTEEFPGKNQHAVMIACLMAKDCVTIHRTLCCRVIASLTVPNAWPTYRSANFEIHLNFYRASILGETRLSGATSKSVLNSKIDGAVLQHPKAIRRAGVYGGKAKSKRCVVRYFLKVATEMTERTDNRRLFQRDGAQE